MALDDYDPKLCQKLSYTYLQCHIHSEMFVKGEVTTVYCQKGMIILGFG